MSKFLLAELTYSLDSEDNVQTFPIKNNKISRTAQVNDSLEGLCSETTTRESCGSQNAGVTAAVTFEIVDNWGNEDYTCLYRIRIHGEPFQS
jgi:SUN domain-containing protein 1/2